MIAEGSRPVARAEALAAAANATGLSAGTGIALGLTPGAWPWALGAAAVTGLAGYVLKYRAVQAGARDQAERAIESSTSSSA